MSSNNSDEDKCRQINSIKDFFIITGHLGKGGFGNVWKGKIIPEASNTLQSVNIDVPIGIDIAIKEIQRHMFDMNEISILFKIKNLDYISRYYGCLYNSKS